METLILSPIQKLILKELGKQKDLSKKFYFTGGTALCAFYLQHRYSEDLDFFNENKFEDNEVIEIINKISSKLGIISKYTKKETVLIFQLTKGKESVKIDFGYYPYHRIEKGINYQGILVDSLRDIATNKLLTITQRTDVKDYVDLYFLLKEKFTIWDLLYGIEKKFRLEIDLILLGSNFFLVEKFDFLPRMIKPLTLDQLKEFFRKRAIEIGKKVTF